MSLLRDSLRSIISRKVHTNFDHLRCLNNLHVFFPQDPFETKNMEPTLTTLEKSFLHDTLEHMKGCKGKSCILPRKNHPQVGQDSEDLPNNINAIPFRPSKRRHGKIYFN